MYHSFHKCIRQCSRFQHEEDEEGSYNTVDAESISRGCVKIKLLW